QICKVDIIHFILGAIFNFFLKSDYTWMQSQLKNIEYLSTCFSFYFLKSIQIPWIEHYWLLTNSIGALSQSKTYMRIMKVIGSANAYKIHLCPIALQFVNMPVKSFKFSKEVCIGEKGIKYANAVKFVKCSK